VGYGNAQLHTWDGGRVWQAQSPRGCAIPRTFLQIVGEPQGDAVVMWLAGALFEPCWSIEGGTLWTYEPGLQVRAMAWVGSPRAH
jgi:hypothetical protein